MVGRPAGCCRIDAFEAQCLEVQLLDERIDDPHRVVFADIVVKALSQQSDLMTVLAFDESLHVAALQ